MKKIIILSFSFTLFTVYYVVYIEEVWAGVVYYHSDHLGSSSVLTDELGGISGEMQYYPYGTVFLDTRVDVTPHTFTGQEEDEETGLYYYGARYYDSFLGKFLSPDPIWALHIHLVARVPPGNRLPPAIPATPTRPVLKLPTQVLSRYASPTTNRMAM